MLNLFKTVYQRKQRVLHTRACLKKALVCIDAVLIYAKAQSKRKCREGRKMSKKDKKGVDKQKSKWYPLEAVSEGNKT